jgi:hypothetical protein
MRAHDGAAALGPSEQVTSMDLIKKLLDMVCGLERRSTRSRIVRSWQRHNYNGSPVTGAATASDVEALKVPIAKGGDPKVMPALPAGGGGGRGARRARR